MARRITMDLLVKVLGQKEVMGLEWSLQRLNKNVTTNNMLASHGRRLNQQQTDGLIKQNVVLQARLKSGQRSITQLAKELNLNEQLNATWEHTVAVNQRALNIKKEMIGVSMPYARYLANEQIIVDENTEAQIKHTKTLQMKRREILASTMAIFGMTMSIWQMTNALSALAGENEEVKKDMKTLQAVMMGATGPLLLFHGIIQLTTMGVNRLGMAMMTLLPLSFAIAAAYMALTSSSKELRAIFGALAGMLAVLTAWQIKELIVTKALTREKFRNAVANLWKMATEHPVVGIAFAAAAVAGAIAAASYVPSGQTAPGQYRRIEKSGLIFAHKPETIGQVSEPMEGGTRSGTPQIIILEVDGEELGRVWANTAERETFMG